MSEERKRSVAPWIAGVVLVLLGLYVGGYYAMVRPTFIPEPTGYLPVYRNLSAPRQTRTPSLLAFFAPVHRIDRRLRPNVWEPKGYLDLLHGAVVAVNEKGVTIGIGTDDGAMKGNVFVVVRDENRIGTLRLTIVTPDWAVATITQVEDGGVVRVGDVVVRETDPKP